MTTPTLREVARRAAIELNALYYQFQTKDGCSLSDDQVVEVIERHFAEVHAQVAALREALDDVRDYMSNALTDLRTTDRRATPAASLNDGIKRIDAALETHP